MLASTGSYAMKSIVINVIGNVSCITGDSAPQATLLFIKLVGWETGCEGGSVPADVLLFFIELSYLLNFLNIYNDDFFFADLLLFFSH